MSDNAIILSGFQNSEVNGTYTYQGEKNGYPYYAKGTTHSLIYYSTYMPWSNSGGYYIIAHHSYYGSVNIAEPKFYKQGTDFESTTYNWVSLLPSTSGEQDAGDVYPETSSSSES